MRYTYEIVATNEQITPFDAKEKFVDSGIAEFDEDEHIVSPSGAVIAHKRLIVPECWTVRINDVPDTWYTNKQDAFERVRHLAEKAQGLNEGAYYGNLNKNGYLVAVQSRDGSFATAVIHARKEDILEVYGKEPIDFWKEVGA